MLDRPGRGTLADAPRIVQSVITTPVTGSVPIAGANLPAHAPAVLARQQATACAATVLLFLGVALAGVAYPSRIARAVPVDEARLAKVSVGIDPNSATWFEIAQLPGIGEKLAKRVIACRESRLAALGPSGAGRVVFRRPADLAQVKGIGEKTVLRIGRFLRFPADGQAR